MASWQDGAEYAPTEVPLGFAAPRAKPLGELAAATNAPSAPDNAPTAVNAPNAPVKPLSELRPAPPELRDPRQPFDSKDMDKLGPDENWDPRRPLLVESGGRVSPDDWAPPPSSQRPVVPTGWQAATGAYPVATAAQPGLGGPPGVAQPAVAQPHLGVAPVAGETLGHMVKPGTTGAPLPQSAYNAMHTQYPVASGGYPQWQQPQTFVNPFTAAGVPMLLVLTLGAVMYPLALMCFTIAMILTMRITEAKAQILIGFRICFVVILVSYLFRVRIGDWMLVDPETLYDHVSQICCAIMLIASPALVMWQRGKGRY
jgi:hypothetical protein